MKKNPMRKNLRHLRNLRDKKKRPKVNLWDKKLR